AGERLAVGAEYEVVAALVVGRVEERDGQPDLAAGHGVDAHRAVVADRADQLAVGRKRHALHLELMAVELEHLLAGLDLPEPNRLVVAAGGERLAVGREGQRGNIARVAGEDADFLAGRGIEQPNIFANRERDLLAVWATRDGDGLPHLPAGR